MVSSLGSLFVRMLLGFTLCRGAGLGQGEVDLEDEEGAEPSRPLSQRRRGGAERLLVPILSLKLDKSQHVLQLRLKDAPEGGDFLLGVEPPRDARCHWLLLEGCFLLPNGISVECGDAEGHAEQSQTSGGSHRCLILDMAPRPCCRLGEILLCGGFLCANPAPYAGRGSNLCVCVSVCL